MEGQSHSGNEKRVWFTLPEIPAKAALHVRQSACYHQLAAEHPKNSAPPPEVFKKSAAAPQQVLPPFESRELCRQQAGSYALLF